MSIEFMRIALKKTAKINAPRIPAKKCLSIWPNKLPTGRSMSINCILQKKSIDSMTCDHVPNHFYCIHQFSPMMIRSIPGELIHNHPANVNLVQRKGPYLTGLPEDLMLWLRSPECANISGLIEQYNNINESDSSAQQTFLGMIQKALMNIEQNENRKKLLDLVLMEIQHVESELTINEQALPAQMSALCGDRKESPQFKSVRDEVSSKKGRKTGGNFIKHSMVASGKQCSMRSLIAARKKGDPVSEMILEMAKPFIKKHSKNTLSKFSTSAAQADKDDAECMSKSNSLEESKDLPPCMPWAGESAMSLGVPQISANIYNLSQSQMEELEQFPAIRAEVNRLHSASSSIGRKAILESIQMLTQDVLSLTWLNTYANEELLK
jgi:hypothetical protein